MEDQSVKKGLFGLFEIVMDAAALNLLFLVCCLPLITVGASLTALYAGWRAAIKREPCFRAFFKAFKSGFVRATLAWLLLLIPTAPMVANTAAVLYYRVDGYLPALILSALVSLVLLAILNMVFLFYSRFECTLLQLLKYGGTLALSYPLRALLIVLMMAAPFVLLALAPTVFLILGIVWLFFYFSVAAVAAIWLMNRPFARFAQETLGYEPPEKQKDDEEETQ